jgi:hypothetical protein
MINESEFHGASLNLVLSIQEMETAVLETVYLVISK